jgi:phosphoadenosine phosphosulfate reductase
MNVEVAAKDLETKSAQEVIEWSLAKYGNKVGFASSFGAEDVVLIDLLMKADPKARVFTLDTGRLPAETYNLMDEVRVKYNLNLEVFCPDTSTLEKTTQEKGFNFFYKSIEDRRLCCKIRKIEPLERALGQLDAWMTGLRREQSVTRTEVPKIAVDEAHGGIAKINPLADWSEAQVWEYIKANEVPYNALHDKNYPSIGCAPCTRAVKEGEDVRAGRWWWESPDKKECGLHK